MKIKTSRNFYIILLADVFLLSFSFYLAHVVRFDFIISSYVLKKMVGILPFLIVIKLFCFIFFDLYRGMWRYTGLNDLINVGKASTAGTLCVIVFVLFVYRFQDISRSVFIIDWCLTLIFIIGLRVLTRVFYEKISNKNNFLDYIEIILNIFKRKKIIRIKIVILGAGYCGEKICRELKSSRALKYELVGFLDDDSNKIGRKIHGIPIIDTIGNLDVLVEKKEIQEAIIAISSLSSKRMREIVEACKTANINFKTIPHMGELIDGKISIKSIRDVEYRDLLGRKPVQLDKKQIGGYIGQKTVLVTGAGGSIGQGLCRQICRYSPDKIVLFERAESPLYEIDLELQKDFPETQVIPVLGDITKQDELEKYFSIYRPEIVFHAAAYKHVPMLEQHPWKAVENNVFGTENLVEIAKRYECKKFVFVSTDKAVNPTNIMGASKRIAENIVQCKSGGDELTTQFITVRFGNVIGSAGSVIPLFKKQIKEGGPVTVTHPEVIRYFMLIPEACQLILQAGAMGEGREIFVLEMGEPVKIDSMARDLIRFSGFVPDTEIAITYTGLRPGEKLYEELMTQDELVVPTQHKKILVLNSNTCDHATLSTDLDSLRKILANGRDKKQIIELFMKMVPEYHPNV